MFFFFFPFEANSIFTLVECTWTLKEIRVDKNMCSWQKCPQKTKPHFLAFENTTCMTVLHAMWHFHKIPYYNSINCNKTHPTTICENTTTESPNPIKCPFHRPCEAWMLGLHKLSTKIVRAISIVHVIRMVDICQHVYVGNA